MFAKPSSLVLISFIMGLLYFSLVQPEPAAKDAPKEKKTPPKEFTNR
jgi:hypothetical protein